MKAIWNGTVVADSDDTVVMDGNHYFPAAAVDPKFLLSSNTKTMCSVKGQATYFTLFVDGAPSDSATTSLDFHNAILRPIIGRLQPNPRDELRQWIGGIDEVAIYGRALTEAEIRAHAEALKP